jgi:hypothetical protein
MRPDHLRPGQVAPDQLVPVQPLLLKLPPVQLVPARLLAAQARLSEGTPKMSCSPRSSMVPSARWLVPRASSREPVPVAGVKRWLPVRGGGLVGLGQVQAAGPWAGR